VARWLWAKRKPISGSIAETYLRSARGYGGRLPETLGFLPGRGDHPPAMIAAFGMAIEPEEPGKLAIGIDAVKGVHLTRLLPDGSGKAVFDDPDEPAKARGVHSDRLCRRLRTKQRTTQFRHRGTVRRVGAGGRQRPRSRDLATANPASQENRVAARGRPLRLLHPLFAFSI
jgi:hypothetical protein